MSQPQSGWGAVDEDDEDEDDDEEQYYYNENVDEDEFGLPSITSMRREVKNRIHPNNANDPGGGLPKGGNGIFTTLAPEQLSGRGMADSSDIAEVRESLNYSSAKKSEGKILRPQYKDILRGSLYQLIFSACADRLSDRSCQFPTPHKPSTSTSKRLSEGRGGPLCTNIADQ